MPAQVACDLNGRRRLFFGWRGGFGILLDDFVAAFCTLLVIAAWRAW